MTDEELIDAGYGGGGTPPISIERLRALIPALKARNLFVHSMEAFYLDAEEWLIPLLEFAILGLHIGYDTADDVMTAEKQFELLDIQLRAATECGLEVVFQAWFDCSDDYPSQ